MNMCEHCLLAQRNRLTSLGRTTDGLRGSVLKSAAVAASSHDAVLVMLVFTFRGVLLCWRALLPLLAARNLLTPAEFLFGLGAMID